MPNITREQLLALPDSGHRNEFIEIATHVLNAQPDDAEIRLGLIRCLTEFGLLHRAAEIAAAFDPEVLGETGLGELMTQLRTPTQNGHCDWSSLSATFERNLQALKARYDWCDRLQDGFNDRSSSLELNRTREGRWEIFDLAANLWRPCFGRHQPVETFESIRRQVDNRVIAPIVIEGVALGTYLPLYVSATHRTMNDSSPFVYQVETDWGALAAALHLNDWTELIADPRVILCAGENAYDQLDESIGRFPHAPLPKALVTTPVWTPDSTGRAEPIFKKHADTRHAEIAELRQQVNEIYAGRDTAHWARRYQAALSGDDAPLRVLSITCRFTTVLQYATRDALATLESLGCETRVVIEPDDQSHISPIVALEAMRDFEPDMILLIDHTRASQPAIMIENIPVLTWIQDRLPWLFDEKVGKRIGPLDFVMGQGKRDLVRRYAYPAERFLSCEMATDVARLTSPLPDGIDASQFDCEIAFATHASETPDEFSNARLAECDNPKGRAIIEAIRKSLGERLAQGELNGALNFNVFVAEVEATVGASLSEAARDALIDQYARPLAERMIRQETLRWAARWAESTGGRLHIYGDGWEKHPEFAAYAKGTIEHGAILGEAFRRARVNLHSGCNLALHQRVLDGLAAGGFFLARRHAGDIGLPVMEAINAYVQRHRIQPPAKLFGGDLPAPWHTEHARLCRMKGVDVRKPLEFTEQNLARIRAVCERKEIVLADQLWPDFESQTFETEREFVERVEYFLARPAEREERTRQMRQGVLQHFGYEPLIRQVLAFTAERLCEASRNEESAVFAAAEASI